MTTTSRTRENEFELPYVRGPRAGTVAFGFVLSVLAAGVLAAAFAIGLGEAYAARVMPGVSVAGIGLAGLDRAAAETRLRESLPPLADGTLTLAVEGQTTQLPYRAVGRDYDITGMLDAAFSVGRTGAGPVIDAIEQVRSLVRGTDVVPTARFDSVALAAHVESALRALHVAPVEATVALDAEAGSFIVTPSAPGRAADTAAAVEAATASLGGVDPSPATIAVAPVAIPPRLSTAAAQAAADRAASMTARPLTLTAGDASFPVVPEMLRSWITFETGAGGGTVPTVAAASTTDAIEALRSNVDVPARNATFKISGSRVSEVVPGVDGRRLDTEATAARVAAFMNGTGSGSSTPSVALSLAVIEPDVTTAEAEAVAPKMRRVGTWTTNFEVNEKNYFGKNISIPTNYIDGTVVAPGDWFSFWETVGLLTPERGFGPGGAIINGRTEPTGALAGGICSCSTTLFNAALRAGYEMGERRNHYYYISRYPRGLDATVFKSDEFPDQDMTFRNDTEYPLLIRGINGPGSVTFELYSVNPGRKVVLSDPVVKNPEPAEDTVEYTAALPRGQSQRVEYPADGFDSWVTRTVYQGDEILHQETYHSHYARVDGVVRIGR